MVDVRSTQHWAIPGLHYLSGAPVPNDRRLKVFWLDDKTTFALTEDLKSFIQVTRALAPESSELLLRASRREVWEGRGAEKYELHNCPHDVYLADFRLSEAPEGEFGGELSLASRAEAAGLTTAVLMAASFQDHPATIVPYTAFEEELQAQRDLLKRLGPDFINIRWGDELGKLEQGVGSVLEKAISEHRRYLPLAAQRGFIHLGGTERERLAKIIDLREGSAPVPWDLEINFETQWGRRRLFLFALWPELGIEPGASIPGTQLGDVLKWLEEFPPHSDAQRAAADLAYTFFCQRISLRSHDRYLLGSWLREGFGPDERNDVKILCDKIGLQESAVQAYAEAVRNANAIERNLNKLQAKRRELEKKKPAKHSSPDSEISASQVRSRSEDLQEQIAGLLKELKQSRLIASDLGSQVVIPVDWSCPHLLSRDIKRLVDEEALRLAVLFLLVYEAAFRWSCSELLSDALVERGREGRLNWSTGSPYPSSGEVASFIQEVRYKSEAWAEGTIAQAQPNEILEAQMDLRPLAELLGVEGALDFFDSLDPEARDLWRAMRPMTTGIIAQLLDPLPEQIQTADVSFKEGRIGVALSRINLGQITELLSGEGRGVLADFERRATAQFALDIGFPSGAWPRWLRWPGPSDNDVSI
jgi:hypothetical protein